jgi:hypothetical protein
MVKSSHQNGLNPARLRHLFNDVKACIFMERKTISLPDDLAEFVDKKHINLSRFVQDKLRDLSESDPDGEEITEKQAKEIYDKLEKLGYLDR